jgi:hypothetical protein
VDPQNKAGKLITATSVNAVTGVSDPTYCEYHTAQGGTIGVGTLSSADSADAWNRLKDRHEEEPIQGLGGDEATTLGAGLYMIRKGDISITVQGMPSGLDTPTLERIVRAAVAVL